MAKRNAHQRPTRLFDRGRWTPEDLLADRPELRVYLHDKESTIPAVIDPTASNLSRVMLRYQIPFGPSATPGCRTVRIRDLLEAITTRRPIRV